MTAAEKPAALRALLAERPEQMRHRLLLHPYPGGTGVRAT